MLCFFHHPGIVPVPDIDFHEQESKVNLQEKLLVTIVLRQQPTKYAFHDIHGCSAVLLTCFGCRLVRLCRAIVRMVSIEKVGTCQS